MKRAAILSASALFRAAMWSTALLLASLAELPRAAAQSSPPADLGEVDVALVLAVDISFSMDLEELAVQRAGYVEALRSPEVHKAIEGGATGRIAITFFEWAGSHIQHHLIPWSVIDSPASANRLADELEKQPTRRGQRTSVAGAIDTGARLLDEAPLRALRKVIDISGDGPNNMGRPVTQARDEALDKGITINGLPVIMKRPGYLDIDQLDLYYEDCVIGGRNAFSIPIREKAQFAQTIRTKLVMEISEAPDFGNPLIQRAQAKIPRVSCTVGEDMWRERMRN
jgi:hypothetical protein